MKNHEFPAGQTLKELVNGVVREETRLSVERRHSARQHVTLEVHVQPVDDDFNPVGEPFKAITRDICNEGIGLLHKNAVEEKYLQLQLGAHSPDAPSVVMEVLHCQPVGPFHHIGGRFVAKQDASATAH